MTGPTRPLPWPCYKELITSIVPFRWGNARSGLNAKLLNVIDWAPDEVNAKKSVNIHFPFRYRPGPCISAVRLPLLRAVSEAHHAQAMALAERDHCVPGVSSICLGQFS